MTSCLMNTAHEIANDLYEAGVIEAVTMREYEGLALSSMAKLYFSYDKQQLKTAVRAGELIEVDIK